PRQTQRFLREARSAAQLHHANIVPVFGVGEQDGLYFYAMQFISGQGLDKVLEEVKRHKGRTPAGHDADDSATREGPPGASLTAVGRPPDGGRFVTPGRPAGEAGPPAESSVSPPDEPS